MENDDQGSSEWNNIIGARDNEILRRQFKAINDIFCYNTAVMNTRASEFSRDSEHLTILRIPSNSVKIPYFWKQYAYNCQNENQKEGKKDNGCKRRILCGFKGQSAYDTRYRWYDPEQERIGVRRSIHGMLGNI